MLSSKISFLILYDNFETLNIIFDMISAQIQQIYNDNYRLTPGWVMG
jgi:hypothetical protein